MKIHAYEAAQKGPRTLEELLRCIHRQPLENRFYLGEEGIRLEDVVERDGLWFADFVAPRGGHGPGKMKRSRPLEGIQLQEDERFGEDTGMVYDPATRYAAVQYNHFGPRIKAIENYLYAADLFFRRRASARRRGASRGPVRN
ncbi:DUF6731 family protein [Nitratireductor aquibiodomus]|uniref:DUF6731 family protein n=1 Tax=Nitratireductor aquibiodomus TaxID=204799 RepID=UPI0012FE0D61|nr:DUF6731 family protein [Nitratireductor aquibiodomus]